MKTLNTQSRKSSFTSLSKSFFILLTLNLSMMFALAIEARGQTFNFSLTAYGPHNVVQGQNLYINVVSTTVSGSGGNTYMSVQNVPAGASPFWPELLGGGNDGSYYWQNATFDTALRVTAGTNTPVGSYTIQITATNNGVTRQAPYTFNVVAPPAPSIPPNIGAMPAIPNLSNWQSNMNTYGQQVCNYLDTPGLTFDQKLSWVYYDQIRVMYQISDYIPAASSYWNACALKARNVYRDTYVLPNNGGVAGHWNFTTGLRMDFERTADTQSKNAALLISQNAAFASDATALNSLIDGATSRETAYAILAKLDAEKLGNPPSPRLTALVDIALGHMDQWFVSKTFRCRFPNACDPAAAVGNYYIQPFMVGLTMRALIVYYEKTQDPRIPPIIKTAADWLWANAWVSSGLAFWYQNHVSDPSQAFPSQPGADDLNLLIAPAFAWLYRQTGDATYQSKGDQIFSGGVLGPMSQGNLGNGKQFDQNYIWSFDYVKWRTASPSASLLISELRTSGPAGAGDDFVEIYNNSDVQLTVSTLDGSAGFGLFKIGSNCSSSPILIGTIPNGTVIPARGHYLFTGSQYSLQNYGGTNAAAGDRTLTSDIENDRNLAIFSTANAGNLSIATRLDAAGFGANMGSTCDLFREGNTLPAVSGSTTEHSYFRKLCDFVAGCTTPGTPKDTNQNLADFMFADTNGNNVGGQQRLGAPGPENLASPIKRDPAISGVLLDATVGASVSPNRVRNTTSAPSATFGTMTFSFRFVNQTGAPVGRLRFRIIEMTTFPSPSGSADLRALTSNLVVFSGINDAATCLASNGSASTPCVVSVQGTTLEAPPAQPFGGGLNSTLSAGTVTLGSPLASGASVNVQLRLGVERTGSFRFLVNVEALPALGSSVPVTWTEIAYAAPEADGGITTTTLDNMATATATQHLSSGKYWETIPNNVSGNTQYRINTVGNRDVYRRISFGGGYLSFYNTSGVWQAETPVTTSSVIRISLEGTNLRIYKDGILVYTFTDTLSAPLEFRKFIWVTPSNLGAGLTSASFGP